MAEHATAYDVARWIVDYVQRFPVAWVSVWFEEDHEWRLVGASTDRAMLRRELWLRAKWDMSLYVYGRYPLAHRKPRSARDRYAVFAEAVDDRACRGAAGAQHRAGGDGEASR
ncbi:hypothetical protein [Amycolatopsis cihanbeyliensis]|uniref:hypothetical protein n=1 Tax=Amycolatopsis cihanbeyliensis TaxID=1128664 RepID=UPI00114E2C9E|nr:hypothetical protein [Amycolatopsis cihanbeyliensis]